MQLLTQPQPANTCIMKNTTHHALRQHHSPQWLKRNLKVKRVPPAVDKIFGDNLQAGMRRIASCLQNFARGGIAISSLREPIQAIKAGSHVVQQAGGVCMVVSHTILSNAARLRKRPQSRSYLPLIEPYATGLAEGRRNKAAVGSKRLLC